MTKYSINKPPPGIRLDLEHPLSQGLIGCWLFDEGSGLNTSDLTGNSNNGTLNGMEPFSSTSKWTGSVNGTTLLFNGTTSFVQLASCNKFNVDLISVETTVTPSVLGGVRRIAVQARNAVGATVAWSIHASDGALVWGIKRPADGGAAGITQGGILAVNRRIHIVGTYDGTNLYLYVDGTLRATASRPGTIDYVGVNPILVGETNNAQFWNGEISHVRIWNRTLSLDEATNLYAQPFSMFKKKSN